MVLTVFLTYRGVVHHKHAPEGQTANKPHYREILLCLSDAVWHKRLKLWKSGSWQLHHDNILAHYLHLIQEFLTRHGIPQVCQSSYFPDMTSCVSGCSPS